MTAPDVLWRVIAALAVACAPVAAQAQSRDADPELESLIPDSALDNPQGWALDTDAARTKVPDVDKLTAPDALAPPTDIPAITIPWPETNDLPAIAPLTPDPDIGAAEEQAKAAGEALDKVLPEGDVGRATIANASIERIGNQVELAFPPDTAFPERDAVATRFAGLSSLKALDKEDDNLAQLSRRAKEDVDLLQRVMRLYGYYDAEVVQSLSGFETPAEGSDVRGPVDVNKVVVRFDVVPGPQYKLAKIALGDIAQAGEAAALRAAFALQAGDPVNTDRIEEERGHLDTKLGRSGYAFAHVGEPHLLIDHEPQTGDLSVPVTTGGKYAFGAITSSLPKYLSARHLQTMARFRPGQIYDRAMVDDLRQAILATGLVSSVTVQSREAAKPAAAAPGTVDLDVTLAKAPQRTIAGLIGYSSGEGVRLEASWENRNLFPPEGMLRLRGVAGTREQLAGVTFRRNNFKARDQVLTADLYAQTKDTDAYNARTASFITTLEKQTTLIFQKPWVYSIGLQVIATSEIQSGAATRNTYFIGALPLHAGYDGSNDLLDPTRGFRVGLSVSPELSTTDGRKSKYVKAQFDASYYQPVSDTVVIAARTRLGTIQGTTLDNIAPSRRFYAGGGASVRGYAYQAVGPKDAAGDPTGGRSLTEFSLEARIKTGLMGGAVGLVPFVDAGTVGTGTSPTLRDLRMGAGLGIRYQTNFGPIRIDVGTPLNRRAGDSRIGVYVALGQAF
ncbi:MAG: hypothetical protein RIS94_2768 [Pseudomonadota bacterium]